MGNGHLAKLVLILCAMLLIIPIANAAEGDLTWTTILATTLVDGAYGVYADSSGNTYVTGRTDNGGVFGGSPNNTYGSTGNDDVFVTKLNSNGQEIWTTILASTNNDIGEDIFVDSSGNIFVTGYTAATGITVTFSGGSNNTYGSLNTGTNDIFITKLNSNGLKQWTTIIAGSGGEGAYGIALTSSNIINVAGFTSSFNFCGGVNTTYGSTGGNDVALAQLTSNGELIYCVVLASTGTDYGYGIALDSGNDIYITGVTSSGNTFAGGYNTSYGTRGGNDVFIVRLTGNGALQYTTIMGSTGTTSEYGYAIDVDSSDNPYVTGFTGNGSGFGGTPDYIYGSVGGNDVFVTKLDSGLSKSWATTLASTGTDIGYGISVISSSVFVGGRTSDGTAFSSSPDKTFGSTGSNDAFVTKLSTSGTKSWTTILASTSADVNLGGDVYAHSLSTEKVYLASDTGGAATFGGGPNNTYGSTGSNDVFISALAGSAPPAPIPEFNNIGLILAVVFSAAGLILMRRFYVEPN